MARLKVLFADDQIPDEAASDDTLKTNLGDRHPVSAMRQAVKTLRGAGYEVTVARTYADALETVKRSRYDVAIIDLGWFSDDAVPAGKREYAGWDICAALDDADGRAQARPTPQIIYSNRFADDASISIQAADSGKLPVFKNFNEATHHALRAAVKFIEANLGSRSPRDVLAAQAAGELQQIMVNSLKEPLLRHRQWSRLSLGLVAASVVLVLAGAACAIFWNVQVGTVTSVCSVITGIVSALLLKQLQESQKLLEKNQDVIRQELGKAVERLSVAAASGPNPSAGHR